MQKLPIKIHSCRLPIRKLKLSQKKPARTGSSAAANYPISRKSKPQSRLSSERLPAMSLPGRKHSQDHLKDTPVK